MNRRSQIAIVQLFSGAARRIPIIAIARQIVTHTTPKCLSCIKRISGLPLCATNRSSGYTTTSIAQPSNMPSMPNTAIIPTGPSFACKHEAQAKPMTHESGATMGNHARLSIRTSRGILCVSSVMPLTQHSIDRADAGALLSGGAM